MDSSAVRAVLGGPSQPNPTDRGKPGSKHHLLTDARSTPPCARLNAANAYDVTMLLPLLAAAPKAPPKHGGRARRLLADATDDSQGHRAEVCRRGWRPRFGRKKAPHGSRLGHERCVAEHAIGRLRLRYERKATLHQALLTLACAALCAHRLVHG